MNVTAIVQALKGFNADRASMDELMVYASQAEALRTQYQNRAVDVPSWLADLCSTVVVEISRRDRDVKVARLREQESLLAALKTPAEKRADAQAEIERLRKQLGLEVVPA